MFRSLLKAQAVLTPAKDIAGLDLLATAIVLIAEPARIAYANPAFENLLHLSQRQLSGENFLDLVTPSAAMETAIGFAREKQCTFTEQEIEVSVNGRTPLHLSCTVTPVDVHGADLLLELRHIDQQLKIAREERLSEQAQENRELIRNLAHEIKNPLGGVRGAAQLLNHELGRLPEQAALLEYTQVIISEADRLQGLVNRFRLG